MKKKQNYKKWLAVFLLMIPAVYIGVQTIKIFNRTYAIQTAVSYTMADTLSCQGILGMEEQLIYYEGSGILGYIAQNGERVSAGMAVAQVFQTTEQATNYQTANKLTTELELLEKSQLSSTALDVDILMQQTLNGVYDVLDDVQNGNYTNVAQARSQIQLAQNKLQINTGVVANFNDRIAALTTPRDAALAAGNATSLFAEASGYFVAAQDSTQRLYSTDQLLTMTPQQLQEAVQQIPSQHESNVAGKLVLDYRWSYFACVDAKQAEKFLPDMSVNISFPGISAQSVPAIVVSVVVDEENDIAKIQLSSDYMDRYIVALEHEPALISFKTYTGIRIDKEARHVIDGVDYVYVRYGNVAYRKQIKILFEDENYILIPQTKTTDENEVQLFDEIIIHGTDLYDGKVL